MCTHVSAACVRRKKSGGSGGGRTRAARRGSRRRVQHVDLATRQSLPAHAPGTHARARCGREGPEARQSRCGGSAARAPTTCRPRRCAVAIRRRAVPSSRRGATAAAPSSRRQRRAYHRSRCGRRRVLFSRARAFVWEPSSSQDARRTSQDVGVPGHQPASPHTKCGGTRRCVSAQILPKTLRNCLESCSGSWDTRFCLNAIFSTSRRKVMLACRLPGLQALGP